ncbi:hypothetical protein GOODEAATRI_003602, partial [Goodea atripinnis]
SGRRPWESHRERGPSFPVRMSAQERLRRLEELLLEQREAGCLSVEALVDLLLCLYTECSNSPLKREKHITDFLNWGKNRDQNQLFSQNTPRCTQTRSGIPEGGCKDAARCRMLYSQDGPGRVLQPSC